MNSNKKIKVTNVKKDVIKLNKNPKNLNKKQNKNPKKKKQKHHQKSLKKKIKNDNKSNKLNCKQNKVSFSLKNNKIKKYYNPDFKNDDDYTNTTNFSSSSSEFKIEELPEIDETELFN